jgi:hypothetical protein
MYRCILAFATDGFEYFAAFRSATISPNFQRNLGPLSSVQETRASILLQCSSLVRTLPIPATQAISLNWRFRPQPVIAFPSHLGGDGTLPYA